jgi:O-antigen ligase
MNEPNFFGKTTRTTFIFIVLAELLSFALYWLKDVIDLRLYFFILLFFSLIILGIFRLKWLIFIAIIELIIGSKGHLFSLEIFDFVVSIRLAIFLSVIICWLLTTNPIKLVSSVVNVLKQFKCIFYLGIVIAFALFFAFFRGLPLENIFFDINGWLFFLYLFPWFYVLADKKDIEAIIQIFSACLITLISKTLIFLYVFSHQLPLMHDLYGWGRRTLWGEFTILDNGFYRIFSQAHIYVIIAFFIFLAIAAGNKISNRKTKLYLWLMMSALSSVIFIGLSRSFWVGLAVGLLIWLFFAAYLIKLSSKKIIISILSVGATFAVGFALIIAVADFPFPKPAIKFEASDLINERLKEDSAISSRWSQLPALIKAIAKHPVIGSGWGSKITYQSKDPRIKTLANPAGQYTTFTFEWGYLDMILKFGLAGLMVYFYLIYSLIKKFVVFIKKNAEQHSAVLSLGLMLGLAAILVVHFFSPYLNHPLGIGYLLLLFIFSRFNEESRQ